MSAQDQEKLQELYMESLDQFIPRFHNSDKIDEPKIKEKCDNIEQMISSTLSYYEKILDNIDMNRDKLENLDRLHKLEQYLKRTLGTFVSNPL